MPHGDKFTKFAPSKMKQIVIGWLLNLMFTSKRVIFVLSIFLAQLMTDRDIVPEV